jgi:hypothetical protein
MNLKLYEITDQYRSILAMTDSDDDDPEHLAEAIQDTLDGLNLDEDFTRKGCAVACYSQELLAEANSVRDVEESLKRRRKRLETRSEYLRDYLRVQMLKVNKTEIKDAQIVCKLRKSPGRIQVLAEDLIPPEYLEVETSIKILKAKMLEAFRTATVESIPGVEYDTSGMSLTIR